MELVGRAVFVGRPVAGRERCAGLRRKVTDKLVAEGFDVRLEGARQAGSWLLGKAVVKGQPRPRSGRRLRRDRYHRMDRRTVAPSLLV